MKRRQQAGASLIEWLVAGPIVLLAGLLVIQIALLWSARHVADYAAMQAVRHASVANGRSESVAQGIARGFHAYWGLTPRRAFDYVQTGQRIGWIAWTRIAPNDNVFADFGRVGTTASNASGSGTELPNANLRFMDTQSGPRSGLTVFQASQLRLQIDIGLPLIVPIAGPLIARISKILDGCETPGPIRFGLLFLGQPEPANSPRGWACPMYQLPHQPGSPAYWRLPVRVKAQGWMQTPLYPVR